MGTERIKHAFTQCLTQGKKAFIPYLMAGDGGLGNTEALVYHLAAAGATVIELGIPFSDPVADGPVIQAAGQRALAAGTTVKGILASVERIRTKCTTPIVLMTYVNPILQFGPEDFCQACARVGVDGLIVPDLPLEQWELLLPAAAKADLAMIPLVAPTSGAERVQRLCSAGSGFVYTVTVTGVTGARTALPEELVTLLARVKAVSKLPVVAGFGISTKEQIDLINTYVDGVVVGSRIVELAHAKDLVGISELVSNS